MTNLSQMLIAFEQKHDLKSVDIAERIGLHKSTYSRIRNGGIPDAENFVKLTAWMLRQ